MFHGVAAVYTSTLVQCATVTVASTCIVYLLSSAPSPLLVSHCPLPSQLWSGLLSPQQARYPHAVSLQAVLHHVSAPAVDCRPSAYFTSTLCYQPSPVQFIQHSITRSRSLLPLSAVHSHQHSFYYCSTAALVALRARHSYPLNPAWTGLSCVCVCVCVFILHTIARLPSFSRLSRSLSRSVAPCISHDSRQHKRTTCALTQHPSDAATLPREICCGCQWLVVLFSASPSLVTLSSRFHSSADDTYNPMQSAVNYPRPMEQQYQQQPQQYHQQHLHHDSQRHFQQPVRQQQQQQQQQQPHEAQRQSLLGHANNSPRHSPHLYPSLSFNPPSPPLSLPAAPELNELLSAADTSAASHSQTPPRQAYEQQPTSWDSHSAERDSSYYQAQASPFALPAVEQPLLMAPPAQYLPAHSMQPSGSRDVSHRKHATENNGCGGRGTSMRGGSKRKRAGSETSSSSSSSSCASPAPSVRAQGLQRAPPAINEHAADQSSKGEWQEEETLSCVLDELRYMLPPAVAPFEILSCVDCDRPARVKQTKPCPFHCCPAHAKNAGAPHLPLDHRDNTWLCHEGGTVPHAPRPGYAHDRRKEFSLQLRIESEASHAALDCQRLRLRWCYTSADLRVKEDEERYAYHKYKVALTRKGRSCQAPSTQPPNTRHQRCPALAVPLASVVCDGPLD